MDLQQLRIFVAVAEELHVTRAAERLNLTQPAASAAIAALERRYQARLFNRVGRGIELTETGRRFLTAARSVLDRVEAARAVLEDAGELPAGRISIASSQTIANYWLPRRVAAFRAAFPAINLHIVGSNTEEAEKAVLSGDADIGFVARAHHPAIVRKPMATDRLLLLRAKNSGFLRYPGNKDDFLNVPWILREKGSDAHAAWQLLAERHGVSWSDLNVLVVMPSNEAVRAAIEDGAGVGIISEHVVHNSIVEKRIEAIDADLPVRTFLLIHHRDRQLSRAQQAFVAFVSQFDHQKPPGGS